MNFFNKIFSIHNEGWTKIITILGIQLKIGSRKLFKKHLYPLPLDNNKIIFSNFTGRGYGCNPKYITEEIIKRKLPYNIVWLINEENNNNDIPHPQIKIIPYKSINALKEMATAKIWLTNVRLIPFFKVGLEKKSNQIYINTWHGSLGIKKIDADANPRFWETANWGGYEKNDSLAVDYLISNSDFEDTVYKSAFWNRGKILQLGHARNDIFFQNTSYIQNKIKEFYNIPKNTNIMLYVPSYRDDKRLDCYEIDYENLKLTLEQKFKGKWIILTRLHPNIAKFQHILPSKEYIINATEYPDIQELLVSSDAIITDYSSCIFDFMLSRKPGFIYATDIEQYNTDRGFYYPLTSTPFPVAENNEQLRQNILNFDLAKYQEKVEIFLKDKGCIEDGHASERVVDLIEKIMKGENDD